MAQLHIINQRKTRIKIISKNHTDKIKKINKTKWQKIMSTNFEILAKIGPLDLKINRIAAITNPLKIKTGFQIFQFLKIFLPS